MCSSKTLREVKGLNRPKPQRRSAKGLKRSNDILREGPCTLHSKKDSHTQHTTQEGEVVKNTKDRTVEWTERDMGERGSTSHNNKKNKQTILDRLVNKWRIRLDERANCHHQHLRPTEVEYECQRKEVVP